MKSAYVTLTDPRNIVSLNWTVSGVLPLRTKSLPDDALGLKFPFYAEIGTPVFQRDLLVNIGIHKCIKPVVDSRPLTWVQCESADATEPLQNPDIKCPPSLSFI